MFGEGDSNQSNSFIVLRKDKISIFKCYRKESKLQTIVNNLATLFKVSPEKIKLKLDPAIYKQAEGFEVDLEITLENCHYCNGNATCNNYATINFTIGDEPFNIVEYSNESTPIPT